MGGRGIFLFASSQGRPRVRSEDVRGRFLPGHKPRQALRLPLSLALLTAGVPGGRVPARAQQTLGDDQPFRAHGLFSSSMYLLTEDLYPPTPSRVNFAQWEHPEVTSC